MKKNVAVVIAVVVALVALGASAGFFIGDTLFTRDASPYSAVYLVTGDIYFGKLSWFPHPHLTSVWLLQRGVNGQNQPQFAVVPLKSVVWGPGDRMDLNERQIVFWTRLAGNSPVVKAIENPQVLQGTQPIPQGNSGTNSQTTPVPQPGK